MGRRNEDGCRSQDIGLLALVTVGGTTSGRLLRKEKDEASLPAVSGGIPWMPSFSVLRRLRAFLFYSPNFKLAQAGTDFLICPDNTIHQALPYVAPRSPRPFLHIAEAVAASAVERGFRRLALTGTRWLVASDVYPEKLRVHGLDFMRPNDSEREEINRIIMDELTYGIFKPEAVRTFQQIIDRMKAEGCDAVVLGCTEIPLLMNDANSPLPVLDSTRLLARAALRRATRSETAP